MRRMSDTIARLEAATARLRFGGPDVGTANLTPLGMFGTNPGNLTGWSHAPNERTSMPLVVVLHGCTQTAAGYDRGSGWSELADRFGFAVLYPEQNRANNPNACFNWFMPEDTQRERGEAASIAQMVTAMVGRYDIDPARIFVTGLSAGGAMASTMLATYPEVFAGGAVIAGLPFGAASSMPQAFDRMRGHGHPDDDVYANAVRAASSHRGSWPSVSVWHGSADPTVSSLNADRVVGQWRSLQMLPTRPTSDETIGNVRHRVWCADNGRIIIEDYRIAGMGHGTPLSIRGDTACGVPMPYMLDADISSTWQIANGWGLLSAERRDPSSRENRRSAVPTLSREQSPGGPVNSMGVQSTIEAALRSAGLMR